MDKGRGWCHTVMCWAKKIPQGLIFASHGTWACCMQHGRWIHATKDGRCPACHAQRLLWNRSNSRHDRPQLTAACAPLGIMLELAPTKEVWAFSKHKARAVLRDRGRPSTSGNCTRCCTEIGQVSTEARSCTQLRNDCTSPTWLLQFPKPARHHTASGKWAPGWAPGLQSVMQHHTSGDHTSIFKANFPNNLGTSTALWCAI